MESEKNNVRRSNCGQSTCSTEPAKPRCDAPHDSGNFRPKSKTGGPERDPTAGLLVANHETARRRSDSEEAQVIQRSSVPASLPRVRCVSPVTEGHAPIQSDSNGVNPKNETVPKMRQ